MVSISEVLQSEFKKLPAKFRTLSISHLQELQTEIHRWKQNGFITEQFFEQNYGEFSFQPPATLPNARSIIIIGVQQQMFPVEFFYEGRRYQAVLGSNYKYSEIRATCMNILSHTLGNHGYGVERAILPNKLLAVRSGLAKYGKNNICYIDGMGSFIRLEAFFTDYEFPTDDWREKELMASCATCSLCQQACPTRCIPTDRVLIHADQCLAHFNENKGDFPSWLRKQAHNSLVGCMRCQLVCPENKQYRHMNTLYLNFTEDETTIMVRNTAREDIPKTLAEKLIRFDIDEYYPLLGRNLSALMKK